MLKVVASDIAVLDSNVNYGGGTDVTDAIQAVLDKAPENNGVHLIVDGAALIHGLKIHSNTIIECLNRDCGFFMADHTNRPILSNYDWSFYDRNTKNVQILGGTYNHNCTKQEHHLSVEEYPFPPTKPDSFINTRVRHCIYLMEFYGVENFEIRDVLFKNQRTFTLTVGNFKNVLLENSSIDMAEHVHPSNQDGFHFFGPGQFLTMKNVRGCTGDDFINIAPDEMDCVSSITDVLIDGVFFDDTCQGIRMLSRGEGILDRVTVRNVTGTYRTFAFNINPFFTGTFGKYGDIFIENVDLRQIEATYHYTPMTFMQIGGDMECVTLKNIRFRKPVRKSTFIDLGNPFFYRPDELTVEEMKKYCIEPGDYGKIDWMYDDKQPKIRTFIIDGLTIESDSAADDMEYIEAKYDIENLVVRNVKLVRPDAQKASGNLLSLKKRASITNLIVEDVFAEKVNSVISGNSEHKVDLLTANNVVLKNGNKVFDTDDVQIKNKIENSIHKVD